MKRYDTMTRGLVAALALLLCSTAWAANNFAGDGNVVADYDFGASNAFDDQSGNGNHLYWQTGVNLDTANHTEGTGCGDFESSESDDIYLLDADLSSDFPGKSGESNTTFTVTAWFKLESGGAYRYVASKYNSGSAKRSWGLGVNSSNQLLRTWGYNSGSSVRLYAEADHTVGTGEWWFVSAVFDDANNVCTSHAYDVDGGKWWDESDSPTDAMNVEDALFGVGREGNGAYWDGLIDEVCIFNRVVSATDANSIAAGTFNFDTEPNLVSRYRFDKTGLGYDEEGNNHIKRVPIANQTGPNANVKTLLIDKGYDPYLRILDADLSSEFPGKNGSGNGVGTICFWMKCYPQSASGWTFQKGKTSGTDYGYGVMHERYGDAEIAVREGNAQYATSGITPSSSGWYHVACVLDEDNTRVYIRLWDDYNSTLYTDNNTSADFTYFYSTDPFKIGRGDYSDEDFDGYIGELVVFDRALSDSEIDQIRAGTYGAAASSAAQVIMVTESD